MKYSVVVGDVEQTVYRACMSLEDRVNSYLRNGDWKPQGGVSVTYQEKSGTYQASQAVFKENA